MSERGVSGGRCPICGQPTLQSMRPFCSKRCADIDLGRWLTGAYAIPGEDASEGGAGGDRRGRDADAEDER
ncbi:MAG: DNA gyrase inhibitor YacG [Pseudomonadota bacterium]